MIMVEKYGTNVARVFVAFVMLAGGGMKLFGGPEGHETFALLGLPDWFGYFVGVCEIAGAIGIFINPLSSLAALGIVGIMIGAIYFHVMHTPIAQAIPASLVLLSCIFIAYKQKAKLFKFGNAED
jgi:putative oxidoreductase